MALDLFLVPHKPKSRSKSALRKARETLFEALAIAHPGTTLVGDATQGHIQDFPLGELHIRPDELHWAMHGVEDVEPVHALADWFFEHGFACRDPQDAGFARPHPPTPSVGGELEDLHGGQLLSLVFDRNYATALDAHFLLADGRGARLRLLYFARAVVPDLTPLIKAVVTGTTLESTRHYENVTVQFEGGHELAFVEAVFSGVQITEAVKRRR